MNRIREYRKRNGWTIKILADKAGLAAPTVFYAEQEIHHTNVYSAIRLAHALGCTLNDLYPEGGEKRGEG